MLYLGEEKSKRRLLKNCVPQGSVLAPLLFNIYTADLPHTRSKKYADDIALMISDKSFTPIEHSLSEDLDTMSSYFDNWRLKLNLGKTVCSSFHLAHRLADYQLKVKFNGNIVPCESHPKYLGITLNRTLTYKNHLDQLSQKVSARNNLPRRLSGQTWGESFNVLQISAVSLVYAQVYRILCSDLVPQHSHEENRHSTKLYNANRVRLPEVDSSGLPPSCLRHCTTRHSQK